MRARAFALVLACAGGLAGAPAAGAQATWRLEQPDPPAGTQFRIPLGKPGDLQFFAPNRGLLAIEGNDAVARGLYAYDGVRWKQLATVCGGSADTLRVAWAGPREFWTVSEPSAPRRGSGITLCRFVGGEVVASYGTPDQASDPYRTMNAASCNGPSDCWFGGAAARDATGSRQGAFHLHWNGSSLRTVYNPQGRGVSDLEAHAGTIFESVHAGARADSTEAAQLAQPEAPKPRLLHRIRSGDIVNDRFSTADHAGEPADGNGTDMLALDSDGTQLWAVGGAAASGPAAATEAGVSPRLPIAARLVGDAFTEVTLTAPLGALGLTDRFVDVAAVPGTDDAVVAVQRYADRESTTAEARVARIDGATGRTEVTTLPVSGAGRGSAAKVAFTSATDGWLATTAGWLFHFTDGTRPAVDADPAFDRLITFRPNENAVQFVPDAPPPDDASTFAAPPVEVTPTAVAPAATTPATAPKRLAALMAKIRVTRKGTTITVSFTLRRRARVALRAVRKGKVVKRSAPRTMKPGRRKVSLRLDRKRWPTALRFSTRELDLPAGTGTGTSDGGAGAGDTVTTGGDTVTTG